MLSRLCGYCRNYFEREKVFGVFIIADGVISIASENEFKPLEGQYIRVVGSVLNDGVYEYKEAGIEGLRDETFDGAVWLLAIPGDFVTLSAEDDAWWAKYGDAVNSPFSSESISGSSYSYSKASASNSTGSDGAWAAAFAPKLSQWRKI